MGTCSINPWLPQRFLHSLVGQKSNNRLRRKKKTVYTKRKKMPYRPVRSVTWSGAGGGVHIHVLQLRFRVCTVFEFVGLTLNHICKLTELRSSLMTQLNRKEQERVIAVFVP